MKKLFYILTFATSSLLFGQIELQKTINNEISTYSKNGETYYVISGWDLKTVKILDKNFNLYKEFNVDVPDGSSMVIQDEHRNPFILSKGIFDLDDKLDIIVVFNNSPFSLIKIYNEDGEIIKNFEKEYIFGGTFSYLEKIKVFHDEIENINKLVINSTAFESDQIEAFSEIYTLPSKTLSLNENNAVSSSLKIYPNPVTSVLTIDNPNNGVSEAKVFDMNGRLVKTSSFSANDKSVNVNVSDLSKGNYVIKIGNSVSKIIKK